MLIRQFSETLDRGFNRHALLTDELLKVVRGLEDFKNTFLAIPLTAEDQRALRQR
jgi:hypothetical protein